MSDLAPEFEALPPEYQAVIRQAQTAHTIHVTPLQLLVGGWSGAVVYLVSVSSPATNLVEHCILKLDHKAKSARADEFKRHNSVLNQAAPKFARDHVAELVFDRVEQDGAIAIFYRIAGQSLLKYRPLSSYQRQSQIKSIFACTDRVLLQEWNADAAFRQAMHPQEILQAWLGFRLDAGGNIERFLRETCHVDPDVPGVLIQGHVFPGPLLYARRPESWGQARPLDAATGFIHGDLNTNNILVKFSENKEDLAGYYLIDFALFKENMPLLYDQRYLEMSYLMQMVSQVSFAKFVTFVTLLAVADTPDPHRVPIEMAGVSAVIAEARGAFAAWVDDNHPSLHDDLWGQYWLAGVAAGLTYCHKPGLPDEARLAGLIFAAVNLKRYGAMFHLPPPADVALLYDERQTEVASSGTARAKKSSHSLPVQPTPFIGRASQIAALRELLLRPENRLVTLVGPGGTGKTRLSLRMAEELLEQFPQGVFFVPLADDTNASQFISRVAQQLEVREGGRPLLENLKDFLRDKSMLLVLDNLEQLVSVAPLIAELLAAAPQLKILASSRIALNLQAELTFVVPPLELPGLADGLKGEDLAENESVLLFVGRARAARPAFELTDDNLATVAEICRRLDGLPLAIELAAARVKLLPPQAILSRLDDRLRLLTGGARDLPSRHQTIRNTLEWSYGLLNQDEKTLYARLSVFVGGFTLEAAEAVCNTGSELDILEGLASLVNNSLIRQEDAGGEPRFSMLETLRAYALERLVESGEADGLRARHAQYFGSLIVKMTWVHLTSTDALYWLNWLEREHDNIRATLTWCIANPAGTSLGAGMIWMLTWFWYRRGYFSEGRRWAKEALDSPAARNDPRSRAILLLSEGSFATWQGEPETGLVQIRESMSIAQRQEDEELMPFVLMTQSVTLINMGRDRAAQPLLKEALELFREQNQPYFRTITQVHLGNVELGLGNPEEARALHERAHVEARALGENWLLSFTLNNLGEVARTQGQYDLARKYYEESQALLRDTGDQGDVARFVHTLGYIAQHEGEYHRAESQFNQSLVMFRRMGNRRGIAECMAGLAGLRARQGNAAEGAVLLSAAEALLKSTGGAWWPADRVEVDKTMAILQSSLEESALKETWAAGQSMTLEQAIALASHER